MPGSTSRGTTRTLLWEAAASTSSMRGSGPTDSYSSSKKAAAKGPKPPTKPVVECTSREKDLTGGSCNTLRWVPEVQQIAWALQQGIDFEYFLHVIDNGLLCVSWLMAELKYRPDERFVWGRFNCGAGTAVAPTMHPSFVLMSRDVAEWWLQLHGGVPDWRSVPEKPVAFDTLVALLKFPVLDDQERLVGPSTAATFLADYAADKAKFKPQAHYGYGSHSSRYTSHNSSYSTRRRYNSSSYSRYSYNRSSSWLKTLPRGVHSYQSSSSTVPGASSGARKTGKRSLQGINTKENAAFKGPNFCKRFMWASDLMHAVPEPPSKKPTAARNKTINATNVANATVGRDLRDQRASDGTESVGFLGRVTSFLGLHNASSSSSATTTATAVSQAATSPHAVSGTSEPGSSLGFLASFLGESSGLDLASPVDDTAVRDAMVRRLLWTTPSAEHDDAAVRAANLRPGNAHSMYTTPAGSAVGSSVTDLVSKGPAIEDTGFPNNTILSVLYRTMAKNTDWDTGKRAYSIMGPLCSPPPNRPALAEAETRRAARYHAAHVFDQKLPTGTDVYRPIDVPIGVHMDMLGQLLELHDSRRALRGAAGLRSRDHSAQSASDLALRKGLHECGFEPLCMWGMMEKFSIVRELLEEVDRTRAQRCCPSKLAVISKCLEYRKRTFFENRANRSSVMLASFPGSGNTWARMLLEYGSSRFTGSTYDDIDLMRLMPGEGRDDSSVIAVKTHVYPREFMPRVQPTAVMFLVRHPFNALWAEFQRRKSGGHASALEQMPASVLQFEFPKFAKCMGCKWLYFVAVHVHLRSTGVRLLVLKYEDLQQDTASSLRSMLNFVGEGQLAVNPARISCAIEMSNQKSIHRVKKISAEAIWQNQTETACGVWGMITKGPSSRLLLASLGYTNPVDTTGEICAARAVATKNSQRSFGSSYSPSYKSFFEADCSFKFDQSAGAGKGC